MTSAPEDRILRRRAAVARLRAAGLTVEAIADELPQHGIVAPSGRPYAPSTVYADLEALREAWREQALSDTSVDLARTLHELREIREQALEIDDMLGALQAIKQEADLRGLQAPAWVEDRLAWLDERERARLAPRDEVLEVGWTDREVDSVRNSIAERTEQ